MMCRTGTTVMQARRVIGRRPPNASRSAASPDRRRLARRFNVPVVMAVSKKATGAAELKDLRDFHEREAVLKDALSVNARAIAAKRVLLVDDLIRSGATLGAVAAALGNAGAAIIFAFALTKTRRV
jgi:adenine/guanine phosphoribosyltransferase-like PRPP-binding protein